jgi:hypothetical protein
LGTGWIAASALLPDSLRKAMKEEDPPADYEAMTGNQRWREIFGFWVNTGEGYHCAVLPGVNAFSQWARNKWDAQPSGTIGGTATAGEVREVFGTWYSGFASQDQMGEAAEAARQLASDVDGHPDDDHDEPVQQVATTMWRTVRSVPESTYEEFGKAIADYGKTAAGDENKLLEETTRQIHDTNRATMTQLGDKTYTQLQVYNWGGTMVVVIGNHDERAQTIATMGPPLVDCLIAKKRGLLPGSGEWLVEEPGQCLERIAYEINTVCGSPKKVRKAAVPRDYGELEVG